MTCLVVGQNECSDAEGNDLPPFHEGPNAERCNRMYDLAPNGAWAVGSGPGPEA